MLSTTKSSTGFLIILFHGCSPVILSLQEAWHRIFAASLKMKEIASLAESVCKLFFELFHLAVKLGKGVVLPNRKRSGNLLNTVFLLYIGVIENFIDFEYRQFKMANLFSNRFVAKTMMVIAFLLFILTSFEQPTVPRSSFYELKNTECSYAVTKEKSFWVCIIKDDPLKLHSIASNHLHYRSCTYSQPGLNAKSYLENRRLLI